MNFWIALALRWFFGYTYEESKLLAPDVIKLIEAIKDIKRDLETVGRNEYIATKETPKIVLGHNLDNQQQTIRKRRMGPPVPPGPGGVFEKDRVTNVGESGGG